MSSIFGMAGGADGGRLKLAIQRSGRLTDPTLALLRSIGLDFESYGQKLVSHCRNFPLSILFGRDDDIPELVGLGTVDLGIVGRNLVHEEGHEVVELQALGFGACSLVVAVLRDAPHQAAADLASSRIATSYPRSTRRFFEGLGGKPEVITISGSVEVAPTLGIADAIVDLTATGSSLLLNDLRPIATILESEAVLVANPAAHADPERRATIDRLLLRVRAVNAARRFKYVVMNAPESALPAIRAVVPGLKAPTVVPLATPGWVAVHTAIEEETFWDSVEQLRAAGATDILVSSLEKLLL
ncbi:MAG: ATP phosphoribosyltransferase _ HisGl [uncultured Thermomicrobiales bacterium]|uniref:ATP phosphoribosyltransferase n=1 Tax=uncultured Thermomicrobiales bacterium TaxID=1645740 RepID=A0A6J4UCD3_9BACT|nr:MAG: ATP phosphoribosyltransferase > HisGl [uncultured Thermomicrobiales bacterium]